MTMERRKRAFFAFLCSFSLEGLGNREIPLSRKGSAFRFFFSKCFITFGKIGDGGGGFFLSPFPLSPFPLYLRGDLYS